MFESRKNYIFAENAGPQQIMEDFQKHFILIKFFVLSDKQVRLLGIKLLYSQKCPLKLKVSRKTSLKKSKTELLKICKYFTILFIASVKNLKKSAYYGGNYV